MTRRITNAEKKRRLERAYELARERAELFRIPRSTSKGEPLTGWKLHKATGPVKKRNLIAKGATPVLPSSAWRQIYREVGLA